ncbi:MAG: TetR/AcrR family transcriptional regulator [Firmicutes bacterium]|nr:TetR/AcrR family transcriptional regulator [Bacillota bacterium]
MATEQSQNRLEQSVKNQLYAQAKKLFYEKGYNDTYLSEITAGLNMHKTSITYHFGTKTKLASKVISEYVASYSALIDEKLTQKFGQAELHLSAALRYIVFLNALEQDPNVRRFYIEYTTANPINVYNAPSVSLIKQFNEKYNLGLDEKKISLIAIANYSTYPALVITYFSNKANFDLKDVIEYKVKLLFELLHMPSDFIEKTYQTSKKLFEEFNFIYKPYFVVE